MKIGDELMREPHYGRVVASSEVISVKEPCVVIYIHPEFRFYTVEFTFGRGRKFRESYPFTDHQHYKSRERMDLYARNLFSKPQRRRRENDDRS